MATGKMAEIIPGRVHTFATVEVGSILKACDSFGKSAYERLRARAIVLTLRYTALRIGDVSLLARDRLNRDGDRWRIFLRTEKSGQPRVSACAPGFEGSSRLRYGATTQSSLAVSLLERHRYRKDAQSAY